MKLAFGSSVSNGVSDVQNVIQIEREAFVLVVNDEKQPVVWKHLGMSGIRRS